MELETNTLILAIGSTLVTVIGVLWGLWIASVKKRQDELEKCEQKNDELIKEIIKLTGEVNYLKADLKNEGENKC